MAPMQCLVLHAAYRISLRFTDERGEVVGMEEYSQGYRVFGVSEYMKKAMEWMERDGKDYIEAEGDADRHTRQDSAVLGASIETERVPGTRQRKARDVCGDQRREGDAVQQGVPSQTPCVWVSREGDSVHSREEGGKRGARHTPGRGCAEPAGDCHGCDGRVQDRRKHSVQAARRHMRGKRGEEEGQARETGDCVHRCGLGSSAWTPQGVEGRSDGAGCFLLQTAERCEMAHGRGNEGTEDVNQRDRSWDDISMPSGTAEPPGRSDGDWSTIGGMGAHRAQNILCCHIGPKSKSRYLGRLQGCEITRG
ncbi:UNVERIFIED_CONTAM: hypothetical protein PYX00_010961 [Menopon gallinae]|uniref:Uncharacterized protein n=1 Tax=Menopon gallinae TaxID=328185 RepID=A0AAW2H6B0_9NEOP